MNNFTSKQNLIRLPEVQRRTGYGRAWIYKLMENGEFPQQVKIGIRSIAFVESEVDKWVADKIASRSRKKANK